MATKSFDDVMTVAQAAEFLGLSTRRVAKLAQDKRITRKKINDRLYLLETSSVKEFQRHGRLPVGRPKTKKD